MSEDVYEAPGARKRIIDGFELDVDFNDKNFAVYTGRYPNGEVFMIMVCRGSADWTDYALHDVFIAFGNKPRSITDRAFDFFIRAVQKHAPYAVSLTGHSLGGNIAYHLWQYCWPLIDAPSRPQSIPLGGQTVRAWRWSEIHLFNPGAGIAMENIAVEAGAFALSSAAAAAAAPIGGSGVAAISAAQAFRSLADTTLRDNRPFEFDMEAERRRGGEFYELWRANRIVLARKPSMQPTVHHIIGDPLSMGWNEWSLWGKRINYTSDENSPYGSKTRHAIARFTR